MPAALDDYIANLPQGFASYPELQQKASLYRNSMDRNRARLPLDRLPAPLAKLVREPVPVSGYVPLALAHGYFIATRSFAFATEAEFLLDVAQGARNLFNGPLYRILMKMVSPAAVVRNAGKRWSALQRGTTLEMESTEAQVATFVLKAPKPLLPPLMVRYYTIAMTVVLELAGAKAPYAQLLEQTDDDARFSLAWT